MAGIFTFFRDNIWIGQGPWVTDQNKTIILASEIATLGSAASELLFSFAGITEHRLYFLNKCIAGPDLLLAASLQELVITLAKVFRRLGEVVVGEGGEDEVFLSQRLSLVNEFKRLGGDSEYNYKYTNTAYLLDSLRCLGAGNAHNSITSFFRHGDDSRDAEVSEIFDQFCRDFDLPDKGEDILCGGYEQPVRSLPAENPLPGGATNRFDDVTCGFFGTVYKVGSLGRFAYSYSSFKPFYSCSTFHQIVGVCVYTPTEFKLNSTSLKAEFLKADLAGPTFLECKKKAGEHFARLFSEKHLGLDVATRNYQIFCNIWKIAKDDGTVHSTLDKLVAKINARSDDHAHARISRSDVSPQQFDDIALASGSANFDTSGNSGDEFISAFSVLDDGVCSPCFRILRPLVTNF